MYQFGDVGVDLKRLVITRGGAPGRDRAQGVRRASLPARTRGSARHARTSCWMSVWRDTFVTPNVLTRAVAQLRRVLGDDAREARYIETVARRGYRFIALRLDRLSCGRRAAQTSRRSTRAASGTASARHRRSTAAATVRSRLRQAEWRSGIACAARRDAARTVTAAPTPRDHQRRQQHHAGDFARRARRGVRLGSRPAASGSTSSGLAPGSEEVAITNDGGQNMQPDWSPGRTLDCVSLAAARAAVWIVPSTGGTPQQVVERGSQSGVVARQRAPRLHAGRRRHWPGQQVLWTVQRDGGDRRQLTQLGQPAGGHNHPAWSQNGRFIAFAVSNGVVNDAIWIVDAGGGTPSAAHAQATGEPSRGLRRTTPRSYWTGNASRVQRPASSVLASTRLTGTAIGAAAVVMPFENGSLQGAVRSRETGPQSFGVGVDRRESLDDRSGPRRTRRRLRRGSPSDAVRSGRPGLFARRTHRVLCSSGPGLPISVLGDRIDDGSHRVRLAPDGPAGDPSWSGDGTRVLVKRRWRRRGQRRLVGRSSRRGVRTPTGVSDAGVRSPRAVPGFAVDRVSRYRARAGR